tara:strand:- start:630 stop:1145 length:516 start_codon:yes stop_codon:yes gene_type:complete
MEYGGTNVNRRAKGKKLKAGKAVDLRGADAPKIEDYSSPGSTALAGLQTGAEYAMTGAQIGFKVGGGVGGALVGGAIGLTAGFILGAAGKDQEQTMNFQQAVSTYGSAKQKEKMLKAATREQRQIAKRSKEMDKRAGVPTPSTVELPPDMFAASGGGGTQYGNFMASKGFV